MVWAAIRFRMYRRHRRRRAVHHVRLELGAAAVQVRSRICQMRTLPPVCSTSCCCAWRRSIWRRVLIEQSARVARLAARERTAFPQSCRPRADDDLDVGHRRRLRIRQSRLAGIHRSHARAEPGQGWAQCLHPDDLQRAMNDYMQSFHATPAGGNRIPRAAATTANIAGYTSPARRVTVRAGNSWGTSVRPST